MRELHPYIQAKLQEIGQYEARKSFERQMAVDEVRALSPRRPGPRRRFAGALMALGKLLERAGSMIAPDDGESSVAPGSGAMRAG